MNGPICETHCAQRGAARESAECGMRSGLRVGGLYLPSLWGARPQEPCTSKSDSAPNTGGCYLTGEICYFNLYAALPELPPPKSPNVLNGQLMSFQLTCPMMAGGPELSRNEKDRFLYWQPTGPNPLNHRDGFSRPALRHGSLNPRFPGSLTSTFLRRNDISRSCVQNDEGDKEQSYMKILSILNFLAMKFTTRFLIFNSKDHAV